jgi:hypothetical protein
VIHENGLGVRKGEVIIPERRISQSFFIKAFVSLMLKATSLVAYK